jgi:hypothetical protein
MLKGSEFWKAVGPGHVAADDSPRKVSLLTAHWQRMLRPRFADQVLHGRSRQRK